MIIDTIRLQNIKLAVSLIGSDDQASKLYEIKMLRDWAEQMNILANELQNV